MKEAGPNEEEESRRLWERKHKETGASCRQRPAHIYLHTCKYRCACWGPQRCLMEPCQLGEGPSARIDDRACGGGGVRRHFRKAFEAWTSAA